MSLRPKVPPSPKSIAPNTPHQVKKQQKGLREIQQVVKSLQKLKSKDTKLDKFVIESAALNLKEEVKVKPNSYKRR